MKVIEVIPNPYIALDKDGIPQGVVGAGMPGVFIGAQQDLIASQKTGKMRFYFPPNRDGSFTRKVLMTGTIAQAIHAGELIVTNKEDALACGIGPNDFLGPKEALAAEKTKALAYYQSVKGKDAKVGEIPREAMVLKEGDELPVQTASKQITPTVKMAKGES